MNFGFKEHFMTVARHWGAVLIVICVSLFVAGSVAFLSSKVFVSSARVLILNSSQVERATNTSISDASTLISPQDQVQTQVQIARSPLLAERLALELGPERVMEEMTWRWDWLRAIPGQMKDRLILTLYGWEPTAGVLEVIGLRKPLTVTDAGPPVEAARDKIADGLIIEAIDKAEMFVIGFEAPDPHFAAEVVNNIMDIYVAHVVALRSPPGTADIAEKEATRLRTDLRAAEEALHAFSEDNDIYSIDRQKTLLLDRMGRTQDELATAQRDVLEADEKVEAIVARINSLPSDGAVSVTTRPNPVVDQLRQRLSELQTEVGRFVPGSAAEARVRSEIRSVQDQLQNASLAVTGSEITGVNSLYQQLQQTLALQQAERQALQVRNEFVSRQVAVAEDELRRLDALEIEYSELERNVQTKETAYRFAVQELEEIAITDQLSEASLAQVVPVEPAVPIDIASSPRRSLLLAMGLALGLMLGVGLAYLLEFARRTMSTGREAEIALGSKTRAVISRPGLLARRSQQNDLEYRRFATWIDSEFDRDDTTVVGLFSPLPNPAQPKIVDGTSTALRQRGADVLTVRILLDETAAQKVKENIDAQDAPIVEISGPPWRAMEAFDAVLEEHGHQFSYVIVDLPDLSGFPELLQLSKALTTTALIIEADRTRVADARQALAQLQDAGGVLLGLFLNNSKYKTSSWAFSWMALTKRRTADRVAA